MDCTATCTTPVQNECTETAIPISCGSYNLSKTHMSTANGGYCCRVATECVITYLNACVYTNFDCNSTTDAYGDGKGGDIQNFTVENISWYVFYPAVSGDYSFKVCAANCGGGGGCAQAVVFDSDIELSDGTIQNYIYENGCFTGCVNYNMTLVSGRPTYIAIDGNAGANCDVTIDLYCVGGTPGLATVIHNGASNITHNSASISADVIDDGFSWVTEKGVCWSTSPSPTISDNKTSDGEGNGIYTSTLSGLNSATTYYVRAYATNASGTVYSDEFSFTTTTLVGIVENIKGISVGPNPVEETLVIRNVNAIANLTVEILDVTGKLLCQETINGQEKEISLSEYKSGNYFIKVSSKEGTNIYRVLKK